MRKIPRDVFGPTVLALAALGAAAWQIPWSVTPSYVGRAAQELTTAKAKGPEAVAQAYHGLRASYVADPKRDSEAATFFFSAFVVVTAPPGVRLGFANVGFLGDVADCRPGRTCFLDTLVEVKPGDGAIAELRKSQRYNRPVCMEPPGSDFRIEGHAAHITARQAEFLLALPERPVVDARIGVVDLPRCSSLAGGRQVTVGAVP